MKTEASLSKSISRRTVLRALGASVVIGDALNREALIAAVEAAGWARGMCQAVDQLEQALGDPTTGQRSPAWQEQEQRQQCRQMKDEFFRNGMPVQIEQRRASAGQDDSECGERE